MKTYRIQFKAGNETLLTADSFDYKRADVPPSSLTFVRDGDVVAVYSLAEIAGFRLEDD